jgi:uncharacterized protein (TIGR00288 family)
MSNGPEEARLALFIDFENIALGLKGRKSKNFDIHRILERLLEKGRIIAKRAYADWTRYADFRAGLHEAAIELIEVPKRSQTGKNSADIRLVVDALDLCYTKEHLDTFVIVSGDSDFSPLVSKLRENNKHVIGVGVKDSTSDLLSANCDEFIFYDDLVREQEAQKKRAAKKSPAKAPAGGTTKKSTLKTEDDKRQEALACIDRAIQLVGPQPGLLDTKGMILVFEKKPDEAVPLLEEAAAMPDADPRYHFHLAVAYDRAGQAEKARAALLAARKGNLTRQVLTPLDQQMLADLEKKFN